MKPLITIITPTYNRSHLLQRIFESLQEQISKDFEWIIIDDGSTDNTQQVIKSFNSESFDLHYFLKKNGGKHTALNLGVRKAKGEYILILDSDDFLTKDAINTIKNKIPENNKVAGIAFRRIDQEHKIVGSDNFDNVIATPIEVKYKLNVTGDLVEIFKTEILKAYPFPVIENEKFCPEDLIWNRISTRHKLHYYNLGFYVTEYLEGGLSDKIVKIRMHSPKASMTYYSELASYKIPLKEKIKSNINFWRFSFNDRDYSFQKKLSMINLWYMPICFPLGFMMYLNDKRKIA